MAAVEALTFGREVMRRCGSKILPLVALSDSFLSGNACLPIAVVIAGLRILVVLALMAGTA